MNPHRLTTLLALVLCCAAAPAQDPDPTQDKPPVAERLQDEGKIVSQIRINGWPADKRDAFLALLGTREGEKLDSNVIRGDLNRLWKRLKVRCEVLTADDPEDEANVIVQFEVHRYPTFDRVVFRGLTEFEEGWVRDLLGLKKEAPTELSAQNQAETLMIRYRRKGFYFVRIDLVPDEKAGTLYFDIDEGPLVKVRDTQFIGNHSFPASAFLGLRKSVTGGSGMKSLPGFFSDEPYSVEKVEEDLERIRAFYRGQGFRDALVELQDERFHDDRTGVDLVIRIHEGKRYVVESVDVRAIPTAGQEQPRFTPEELRSVIQMQPGEYVLQERIQADKIRLAGFYGKQGYPDRTRFRDLPADSTFAVIDPEEIVDPERGTVRLTFLVQEGKKKRIRDVRILGNALTRDYVIRREVSLYPYEMLDMREFRQSEQRILGLQYFGDPASGRPGFEMKLLPVEGSDEFLDLLIQVEEGKTGQLLFGGGFSTNRGVFANITYRKRNFDWTRPPSGLNPLDWFRQIVDNEAFHGGGQELTLDIAPGTHDSTANVVFREPDLFGSYIDRTSLRINAFRALSRFSSYDQDSRGVAVDFGRNFGRDVTGSVGFRLEGMNVTDIAPDATSVTWDAEGKNDIFALTAGLAIRDMDRYLVPTKGYRYRVGGEWAPSALAHTWVRYWTAFAQGEHWFPVYRDGRERDHVLYLKARLDGGRSLDPDNDELFLTKRFFMGGQSTLRGFDFRGAGPKQFGNPYGGELRGLGTLEYQFPLVSTEVDNPELRSDILRLVGFIDAGMLGDSFDDPLFQQVRVSAGFGFRLNLPMLGGLPLAFDFGWPLRRQVSDDLQVFQFSFRL